MNLDILKKSFFIDFFNFQKFFILSSNSFEVENYEVLVRLGASYC